MAKVYIDEEQQKKIVEQYNAEAAFRSEAYWDEVQNKNPIVQGFRYIVRNYEIAFEKQDRVGKQGDTYRLRVSRRKQARVDL